MLKVIRNRELSRKCGDLPPHHVAHGHYQKNFKIGFMIFETQV